MGAKYRIRKHKFGYYYIQQRFLWLFWIGGGEFSWDQFRSVEEAKGAIRERLITVLVDADGNEVSSEPSQCLLRIIE